MKSLFISGGGAYVVTALQLESILIGSSSSINNADENHGSSSEWHAKTDNGYPESNTSLPSGGKFAPITLTLKPRRIEDALRRYFHFRNPANEFDLTIPGFSRMVYSYLQTKLGLTF